MAYISFDNLNNSAVAQNQQNSSQVGFFSLKNDGDEAIVRFMHDDTASFEILGTHQIRMNGKFRRINCIRNPQDPISACPFCENGEKLDYKFYIHLLQYTNNQDGTVSVEPKVWERSVSYANKMREYITNYGPMSDVVCKVIRHGRAGDMKTEYEIIPNLNQQVYRPDIFKKVDGLFDSFKVLGRIVLDKSKDDINTFLKTGDFPSTTTNQDVSSAPAAQSSQQPAKTNWNSDSDLPTWSNEKRTTPVWTNNSTTVQRPTRF